MGESHSRGPVGREVGMESMFASGECFLSYRHKLGPPLSPPPLQHLGHGGGVCGGQAGHDSGRVRRALPQHLPDQRRHDAQGVESQRAAETGEVGGGGRKRRWEGMEMVERREGLRDFELE